MALDPRFVRDFSALCQNPAFLVDCAVQVFFPVLGARFNNWAAEQAIQKKAVGYTDVYDFLAPEFKNASARTNTDGPDELFRELLKCIIAQALDLEYKPVLRIQLAR